MLRRPLLALAVAYFFLLIGAQGTGGLWAVCIARLGGSPTATGIFNATGSLMGVAGTLVTGWLADRFGHRKALFFLNVLLFALTWALMAFATTWQQLTLINLVAGFTFCGALSLILILTGLQAGETERGRDFGLLAFMAGISLLVGGLTFGPIADRGGFHTLFLVDAGLTLACVVPGLFFVEPAATAVRPGRQAGGGRPVARAGLGAGFYLLTAAYLFFAFGTFGASQGRSIAMSQLGFSATAISLTTAIGGIVSLPAPLLIGWLSDRTGRHRLLQLCLGVGFISVVAFAFAGTAWAFWGASVLLSLMASAQPVMQALGTDLLPAASVGSGLSLLSGTYMVGNSGSSLAIGMAIQGLGQRPAFLLTALMPLLAMACLLPLGTRRRSPALEA